MIRHATLNDLVQIMDITQDAVIFLRDHQIPQWQNHYPNATTFKKDIENNTLYVYEVDGLICGMANIALEADPQYNVIFDGAWLTNGPYAVVHRIAVKGSCIGKGVAKELLTYAEGVARHHKLVSIRIDTHRMNIPMNRLLTRMGYQWCGVIELSDHNQTDYYRLAYEKKI